VEIVEKASSPWVGINLDIGNFPDNGYAQVEMCAPYATNVHFKSHVHVDHQSQPVDFARVLQILGKTGYRGYLALEYESTDSPMTAVPDLISKMRAAIAAYGS
jgi:sugar phosphate isomerase/epimerase